MVRELSARSLELERGVPGPASSTVATSAYFEAGRSCAVQGKASRTASDFHAIQ